MSGRFADQGADNGEGLFGLLDAAQAEADDVSVFGVLQGEPKALIRWHVGEDWQDGEIWLPLVLGTTLLCLEWHQIDKDSALGLAEDLPLEEIERTLTIRERYGDLTMDREFFKTAWWAFECERYSEARRRLEHFLKRLKSQQ